MGQKIIAQRYEVIDSLGAGAMGMVFKGKDTRTNQLVAIKQLKTELTSVELIERFKREGDALRDLNHPNIVKMLDSVEEDAEHYLIMEFVSGGDLSSLLSSESLSISRVLNIALDLCDALTRAHRLQIIHRDLKPPNILITEDGIPKLTDFGIAHMESKERVTMADAVLGTLAYLPPESITLGQVDTRTDIWSFGVVLYELLTGKLPFAGESLNQILTNIVSSPPHDLEVARPDTPLALIDLIYRMLMKDAQERIPSVRLVGAELEAILQGRDSDTSSIVMAKPTPRRFATSSTTSRQQVPNNLPTSPTTFVGREVELAELSKMLIDPNIRLITIIAPGGMGKTRLSLEAANAQLEDFEDGVYLVELAVISDASNIVSAIAEAIGYVFQADGRSEKQQLLDFLSSKKMLLVIDNWEHVIEGATLVTDILKVAPSLQVLATSRQNLGQPGETLFQLSGMDFPDWETPEDAMEYAAMQLFMNSAKRAQPSFELTQDNLDTIARICRLVQGMPLGIVLAAAWLSLLSVEEIVDEIQQGIDILESENGEVPERQRSIRAVFDYSWQQLTQAEQQIFMKMSVFRGGFTRDAVQKICGGGLRQLMAMVNKALLRRDSVNGRYHIHELLRQYAEEQLGNVPQIQTEVKLSHATYFADFGLAQWARLEGTECESALSGLNADIENIRTSWHFWAEQKDIVQIRKLIAPMWKFHEVRGWYQQAINLYQEPLDKLRADANGVDAQAVDAICAYLGGAQAWFKTLVGLPQQGLELAQASVKILKDSPYRHDLFVPLSGLNLSAIFTNQMVHVAEGGQTMLTVSKEKQNQSEEAFSAIWLSYVALGQQDMAESAKWAEHGTQLFESLGDPFGLSVANGIILGGMSMAMGDLPKAGDHFLRGLQAAKDIHYSRVIQIASDSLGTIALLQGNIDEAQSYFIKSLTITERCGQVREMLGSLRDLAQVHIALDNKERAVELVTVILAHPANIQNSLFRPISIGEEAENILKELVSALPTDVYQTASTRGNNFTLESVATQLIKEN
jgi:serine/threonine protein kinase/tetratricopeptide (TPR) repeat protein